MIALIISKLAHAVKTCYALKRNVIILTNFLSLAALGHYSDVINGCDGVSNHQPYDCLLNCLFRHRSKKTSKLCVTGLFAGNSPVTGEFPARRASNVENASIWWRYEFSVQPVRKIFKITFPCHCIFMHMTIVVYDLSWYNFYFVLWSSITMMLRQNGRHFAYDSFKCIFLYGNGSIFVQILLNFIFSGPINNKFVLSQIMDWH